MSSDVQYTPMSDATLEKEVLNFAKLVFSFVESNGYEKEDIVIDKAALYQIISKVDQRKHYFRYFHHLDISDFKELALYCFWIIKLRPLRYSDKNNTKEKELAFESINEKFAVFHIIKKMRALAGDKQDIQEKINKFFCSQYIYELIYSFTYRDISKEAMILLVETMALALGFPPYAS